MGKYTMLLPMNTCAQHIHQEEKISENSIFRKFGSGIFSGGFLANKSLTRGILISSGSDGRSMSRAESPTLNEVEK